MKYRNIVFFTALLSASLITPSAFAEEAKKDDFDTRTEQLDKQYEAEKAAWEKRKNMSLEERRAQDDARWAELKEQYKKAEEARKKQYDAIKAEWEKRKGMSIEELRKQDDARWEARQKQYQATREEWKKNDSK